MFDLSHLEVAFSRLAKFVFFFQEPFIALVLLLIAVCQKTAGSSIVISYFLAH